jgi:hypothetical protein
LKPLVFHGAEIMETGDSAGVALIASAGIAVVLIIAAAVLLTVAMSG